MAMGSRGHTAVYQIEVRNWFTDGERLCVEYDHAAVVTPLRLKVNEHVCLVCQMHEGKFDRIHEYVDTSQSILIGLGLRFLPLILKVRSLKRAPSDGLGHLQTRRR
jgi:hypothetical protein